MKPFCTGAAVLVLLGFTLAFAAEKPTPAPAPQRATEMSAAGRVIEITDAVLRIERSLKGESEVMEFTLEKPLAGFSAGDPVKVSYRVKEGRNVLIVAKPAPKTAVQKSKKKAPGRKPAAGPGEPRFK